ncbi:hypothetical protein [uncultured Kordia sp.]|uniref:hypothetical protein n=1 Tax=uncultured Kordia sp. TaxID=507699 RepID=UPI00262D5212|nr:hypothetical protein [uncultured Kordia sp.]
MKTYIILAISLLLSQNGCEEKGANEIASNNYIRLEIPMYPSNYSHIYEVTENTKKIFLRNRRTEKDSLIYNEKSSAKTYEKLAFYSNKINKDVYENKCIEDGMNFNLLVKKDSLNKNVLFTNAYNINLDSIITKVNKDIPKTHQIYYNKAIIDSLLKNCSDKK